LTGISRGGPYLYFLKKYIYKRKKYLQCTRPQTQIEKGENYKSLFSHNLSLSATLGLAQAKPTPFP
jgi:hypothetical protein